MSNELSERGALIAMLARPLRRVEADDGDDPCWLWTGATTGPGYPVARIGGRVVPLHRLMMAACGADVTGRVIHHVCGNPRCVRPAHLVAMTLVEHGQLHARLRREQSRGEA